MRRTLLYLGATAIVLAAAAMLGGGAAQAAPAAPSLTAKAAAVYDVPTGRFVWLLNADQRRAMASTTKIMTARVVLQSGVPLTQLLTVPHLDLRWDESSLSLKAGTRYTVALLLRAMLVASAGDAASTLADGVAGSEQAFVVRMNAEAARLGLTDTHYVTVSGMDAKGHYTTAHDLTELAAATLTMPVFAQDVSDKSVTIRQPGEDPETVPNTNHLLLQDEWVTGVKTGFTDDAGYCLVASGVYRQRHMIVTVLGSPTSDDRFQDASRLFRYGAALYTTWRSPSAGFVQATATVPYSRRPLALQLSERYTVPVPPGVGVTKRVVSPAVVSAPVPYQARLGRVVYSVAGDQRHVTALVAARGMPAPSWQTRLRSRIDSVWERVKHAVGIGLRSVADPCAVLAPLF